MNFVIIGLGNFGASLAKTLSSMGHEVIGVDRDMSKVEFYKDRISQTICLDASDIHAIRSLPLNDADMVVVAIGHDFGSSVMIAALLRKMKAKNIIARETSSIHITVMNSLGIETTINPEFESALIYAEKLSMDGVKDIYPLSREIKIAEIPVFPFLEGQLPDFKKLTEKNNVEIIAIKRYTSQSQAGNGESAKVLFPGKLPEKFILQSSDTLVVMGNKDDVTDFMKGR
ncbi:MAG: TrkA family potassium uptake protein [Bacteroidales bacterium]|nr:TrkA family potassium uptake protein [Bacteroidales bacterium]MBN2762914.1 TrkA family potassium uptake protein [Bacteroidales bacterium]